MDLQTEFLGEMLNRVRRIEGSMERIAIALEKIARGNEPEEPNYVKPIEDFRAFDWEIIGASIVQQDADGPTHVEHGGFIWTRRSPQNKFDPAIWFSRPAGKDADGNVKYLRLITFRPIKEADPLSRKAAEMAQAQPERKPATPAPAATSRPESHNDSESRTSAPAPDPFAAKPPSTPAAQAKHEPKTMPKPEYMALATGTKFNLSAQAANAVADLVGIKLDDPKADYMPAVQMASYFAECKSLGMRFQDAREVLKKYSGDIRDAIAEVRDNHKKQ